eukprot:TRINITY_DN12252_c0_g1_i2.p1 TRINITY_DN12252_c0_g1~~TRINITY_DN12252_c0_g1_i2.p1  ORF type:complete len:217 (-),score=30.51 TRINITY_DN12252_c0_g1_i2:62-712(-)
MEIFRERKKMPNDFRIPDQFDPVLQYPLPPLSVFLETPEGCHWFRECLSYKHSEENLNFYLQAVTFRTRSFCSSSQLRVEAEEIFCIFIKSSSTNMINLPSGIYSPIVDKMRKDEVDHQIFVDAENHVLKLMFTNEYVGFRNSEFFASWLYEVKRLKAEQLRKQWYKENIHLLNSGQLKVIPTHLLAKPREEPLKVYEQVDIFDLYLIKIGQGVYL